MAADRIPFYSHRQNRDGSFDSICPRCFRTIAREKTESALRPKEETHDCDFMETTGDSEFPSLHS